MVLAVRHPARLVAAHEVAAPHLPAPAVVAAAPAANPEPLSGLLERAKRKWNHLELSGTIWNARRATGTRLSAFPLTLKCVNFVNFVNFL